MAWSLTAKDVSLQGIDGTSVAFTVYMDGQAVTTFSLVPVNSTIKLSLRGILEAILPQETGINPMSSGLAERNGGHTVTIAAADDLGASASMDLTCFRGGIDENAGNGKTTQWLSWKPQASQTLRWGRELLSLLLMPGYSSSKVQVTIYYLYHSPETVDLASAPTVLNSKPCIWTYDCSYETIAELGTYSDEDTILAYDITMGTLPRRRFILSPTDKRGREFIFKNSMGVLDTLYTAGDVVFEEESNVSTSVVNNRETEIDNAFIARQKVSTGLIQREREIANLYDLLRSNERYIMAPGDTARRIVVDGIDSDISFGKPSAATITFHLADGFTGSYYEDKNLGEYEFTSAE